MRHKRLALLLVTLVALCPDAAPARQSPVQRTCSLTVEQSPALRGFRLGMTLDQFKARVPGVSARDQAFGFKSIYLSSERLKELDAAGYEGVWHISAGFLDERLVTLEVEYNPEVQWKSAGQFASRVSEMLKLPDAWGREVTDNGMEMPCAGFSVVAMPNRIRLAIPGTAATVRERRERREEERRQTFRP